MDRADSAVPFIILVSGFCSSIAVAQPFAIHDVHAITYALTDSLANGDASCRWSFGDAVGRLEPGNAAGRRRC